jgi:hypothetical protein
VAAVLALLGLAFYTLLVPWHLTSQFQLRLFEAEFGTFASTLCGSGPVDPGAPKTNCPICKGLAAFHLAVEAAPLPALPARFAGTPQLTRTRDDVAGAAIITPRSRGPPLLA